MSFFTKLSNGWTLAKNSFIVLRENKQLLLFPVLSGISLFLLLAAFGLAFFGITGGDLEFLSEFSESEYGAVGIYALAFVYYLINYFVIVFFNMALIHCTHLYFNGEEPTIAKGIRFSFSRIGTILSWALLSATVGLILKAIQENFGWLGRIVAGLIGIVWSVTTFFVVPVLAYEKVGPLDAIKRSGSLMRQKWGESLGAGFSIGAIGIVGGVLILIAGFLLAVIHPMIGGIFAVLAFVLMAVVLSAAQTVFISAAYHNVTGNPVQHFRDEQFRDLFVQK